MLLRTHSLVVRIVFMYRMRERERRYIGFFGRDSRVDACDGYGALDESFQKLEWLKIHADKRDNSGPVLFTLHRQRQLQITRCLFSPLVLERRLLRHSAQSLTNILFYQAICSSLSIYLFISYDTTNPFVFPSFSL